MWSHTAFRTILLLGALSGLLLWVGHVLGGQAGLLIALGLAGIGNFAAYWWSDRVALALAGERPLTASEAPWLHCLIAQLAREADLPKPQVYLVETEQPNAFAAGRGPDHAAIAVTTGLLHLLDQEELAGVLAHELAHVKNRDVLVASIAATLASAVTTVIEIAHWPLLLGGSHDEEESGGLGGAVLFVLTLVLAPVAAILLQLAVSRGREYGADDAGARLLGDPEPLARALRKLAYGAAAAPANVNPAVSHLFLVPPLQGDWLATLFSTHPPIEARVARLEERARFTRRRMGRTGWPMAA